MRISGFGICQRAEHSDEAIPVTVSMHDWPETAPSLCSVNDKGKGNTHALDQST
jgi:hypothetical protein